MTVLRTEAPVSYKTLVRRTFVRAFRSVFTNSYPEEQFRNLHVVTDYPLEQVQYPAIMVRFDEGSIENFGVGNKEFFKDPDGYMRDWRHRLFRGSVELTVLALSPLDRDILSDALVEVVSHFPSGLIDNFFYAFNGNPNDPYDNFAALSQLAVKSDNIRGGEETANIAPWFPEDTLVYESTYTLDIIGGFYNTLNPSTILTPIQSIRVFAHIEGEPIDDGSLPPANWTPGIVYDDVGSVTGVAIVTAVDTTVNTSLLPAPTLLPSATLLPSGQTIAPGAAVPIPSDNLLPSDSLLPSNQ